MKTLKTILTIFMMMVTLALSAKTIRYVKANATGDGTSWANASGAIQAMIDNSVDGDEVWVAKGTYYPTTETIARDSRSRSFVVKNGVKFYGGFVGTETALSQRAFADLDSNGKIDSFELVNQTILSGDIDGVADVWTKTIISDSTWTWSVTGNSGNCYNVLSGVDKFLIDGFYVKGATKGGIYSVSSTLISVIAKCSVTESMGSGIYTTSLVSNCNVTRCSEGGIVNIGSSSYPRAVVSNCNVTNCSSSEGGGIYSQYPGCGVEDCFVENCSASLNGGGIFGPSKRCTVLNCITSGEGGGIISYYFNIDSCFVERCKASYGGGIKCNVGVNHCNVSNCEAKVIGGGIWGSYVSDCNVTKCRSVQNGGGIWSAHQISSKVYNCTVSNCSSSGLGGGIYGNMIDDCLVSFCSSSNNGGGIYVSATLDEYTYRTATSALVRNCVVNSCFSGNSGGGIYSFYTSNYGYIYGVSNCLVSNCSAKIAGGGVCSIGTVNCTVVNCTSQNVGGIKTLSPSMFILNCAILNCSSSNSTGGSDSGYLINCALSNNLSNGVVGSGVVADASSSYISPDLAETYVRPTSFIGVATTEVQKAELLSVDWHLKKGSPCVNAGSTGYNSNNDLNWGKDLENNSRVLDGIVDIGAYEYQTAAIVLPSSENFDQLTKWENSNLFLTSSLQTKWQIGNQKALFDWHTNLTSAYSEAFVTYPMDATNLSSVFLRYDLYFEAYAGSISPLGTEKLNVEFSTDMTNWTSITAYSNANGTIANKTYKHDISNMAAGKKFYIRFNANGENSNRIEKWEVDNVIVDKDGTSGITPIIDRKMNFTIANGTLKITNLEANSTVELYDMEGKLVSNTQSQTSAQSVSLPHRGVYIVKVKKGNMVETKKLVW